MLVLKTSALQMRMDRGKINKGLFCAPLGLHYL